MNSLGDDKIAAVLTRLQRAAEGDAERWNRDNTTASDELVRMGELYLSVTAEEGRLLYLLARARRARRMVEFGSSYGISTLYLAAAARDNGGHLITTEAHPKKCAAVLQNLDAAGVTDAVSLLEGDARETLADLDGPVDFVFLDGWKGMYLPVLNILQPKLEPGALIVADNISHSAARDYVDAVRGPASGFVSVTVGGQELSYFVGPAATKGT